MCDYLQDARCPATILEELYGPERVGRACSRCSLCRLDESRRLKSIPVGEPRTNWSVPLDPMISDLFDRELRLLVTYDPNALSRQTSRRLGETLQRLQKARLSKLIILGHQAFDMLRILKFAEQSPFFVSNLTSLALSTMPKGPELVMVGDKQTLDPQNLTPRSDNPRMFVAPISQPSPDGRRLCDVFGGRTLTLDEFIARVAQ